jgi:hypothetical protein
MTDPIGTNQATMTSTMGAAATSAQTAMKTSLAELQKDPTNTAAMFDFQMKMQTFSLTNQMATASISSLGDALKKTLDNVR